MYNWKNKKENRGRTIEVTNPVDKPYLITGYEMYLIGSQDGNFPRRGAHIPYEMWGIWAPPIKVMNGFYFSAGKTPLTQADTFEMLPFGCCFTYKLSETVTMERMQWIPEREKAVIVELKFKNESAGEWTEQMGLKVISHLMPTWLSERLPVTDGKDICLFENNENKETTDEIENLLCFYDNENPWALCVGVSEPMGGTGGENSSGMEIAAEKNELFVEDERLACGNARFTVSVPAKGEKNVTVIFAASNESREKAKETLNKVRKEKRRLLSEKIGFYEELDKQAVLSYPAEPKLAEMYRWTRYINDWAIREVSGVGKGLAAGYPEFPWWFGNDTNYIVPALLMQGSYEICKETLRLIRRKSEEVNGNGRVVHEISNNGVVYYEGMTTETPQFADTVWTIYSFTGDKDFLEEMYGFCVQGMEYMENICDEGLPKGYGISEVAGLDCYCCDCAILMVRGYEILARMSEALLKKEEKAVYEAKKAQLWDTFEKEFYLPELGFYADMAATREEILERAETWKYTIASFPITEEDKILSESSCKQDKGPESEEEKKRLRERMERIIEDAERLPEGVRKPYYLFGLGHSCIALEFDYVDSEKGKEMLRAMKQKKEQETVKIEALMPIGLGRDIAGLGNIGCPEEILEKLKETAEGFSVGMPGATNEIYPENGCFVQIWNSFATMWPYFNSLFGVKPRADKKQLILKPCLCEAMKGMELKNVSIAGESFSFRYSGGKEIEVLIPEKSWEVQLSQDRADYTLNVHSSC